MAMSSFRAIASSSHAERSRDHSADGPALSRVASPADVRSGCEVPLVRSAGGPRRRFEGGRTGRGDSSASRVLVLKRSGQLVPFERAKVVAGVRAACKNRPVDQEQIEALAVEVEESMRELGPRITSEQVGLAVLDHLRSLDVVASVRFASVYKGFEDVGDFARELGLLGNPEPAVERSATGGLSGIESLEKQTAPKSPSPALPGQGE